MQEKYSKDPNSLAEEEKEQVETIQQEFVSNIIGEMSVPKRPRVELTVKNLPTGVDSKSCIFFFPPKQKTVNFFFHVQQESRRTREMTPHNSMLD